MKIAVVGLSPNVGGVETFILNMYYMLREKHTFYFITQHSSICKQTEILNHGDKILYCHSRKSNYFKFKKDLKKIFIDNDFDVIWQNNCSLSCIDELIEAKKAGVKRRIIHSHNSQNMGSKIAYCLHLVNKLRLHKYITDSFACSQIAANWMFPTEIAQKTNIIKNAIDTSKYAYNRHIEKEMKKNLGIPENIKIIGHVGRFHEQKNHYFIISVFYEYLKKYPNTLLILCGDGSLKEDIALLTKKLNINDKVLFLGNRNDMENIYQVFDCLLFPSLYEGLPFVLVEAQAAGIPCLISDKISKEVVLTNLINFKSLDDPIEEWVNKLFELINEKKYNTVEEIKDNGYDIYQNSLIIENIFKKKEGE